MRSFDRGHRQVQAALAALSGPEGEPLLAHLRECPECSRSLAGVQDALLAALYLPPPRPMDAGRREEVRARLLSRAGGAAAGRRSPFSLAGAAAGWPVAAGLATLLLTHHAFHRPLGFGWVVASLLGAALFGAALFLLVERRRHRALATRLASLEAELSRVRVHALAGPVLGTA